MSVNLVSLGISRKGLTTKIVVQIVAGLDEVFTHCDSVLLLIIRETVWYNFARIFLSQIFTNNLKYPPWVNVQSIFT
jgi:hypothetical protein